MLLIPGKLYRFTKARASGFKEGKAVLFVEGGAQVKIPGDAIMMFIKEELVGAQQLPYRWFLVPDGFAAYTWASGVRWPEAVYDLVENNA